MDKAQKGRAGEDFACNVLSKKGYRILARNYHSRYGEIDIIAENDSRLAFVEVKARNKKSTSMPRDAVDIRKQKKIIFTAMLYLQENRAQKPPQFDVFEVWHSESGIINFNHLENVFDLSALGGDYELF